MNYNLDNPIAQRETKTVYKDNGKTIKLFVENYSKANILNEALNQSRIEETELNIPELLEVTKIDNRWAIVSEHIEGTTLGELMEKYPEKMDEYMNWFVDIQMEILSKKAPLLNKLKDKMRRKINEADINSDIKYELNTRLEGMPNHDKICHGDFNPSNIIIKDNGKAYIIDWSHVTQGNASADAARAYLQFRMNGKDDDAEKYLNIFSEKSGIPKQRILSWTPLVAASDLSKSKGKEKEFLLRCIDVIEYQ